MTAPTIVGVARLHNRNELLAALEISPPGRAQLPDLELVRRAYERWGARCPERLLGDFDGTIEVQDFFDVSVGEIKYSSL